MITSSDFDLSELDQLAQLPAAFALAQAGLWLESLVNEPTFLKTHILPLLDRVAPADDPSIARTFVSPLGGCSLQVFVWAPGSRTPIHDHTSWGAYYCVAGSVLEDRYERLDDGTQLNRAHLRCSWRRVLHRTDRASRVAPYAGGIHRISNPSGRPAVSVHLYGPRLGSLDGRDYDPSHDYVCDRYEANEQSLMSDSPLGSLEHNSFRLSGTDSRTRLKPSGGASKHGATALGAHTAHY